MDQKRFDLLTVKLGRRLTRRGAVRGGAGLAAATVLGGAVRRAAAADAPTDLAGRYVTIERYSYAGSIEDLKKGLAGLIDVMEQSSGFAGFDVVDAGNGRVVMVQSFFDRSTGAAAAKRRADWIAKHASALLPDSPGIVEGATVLRSVLSVGCLCQTGVQDSCKSDQLICCPTSDRPGGPGICVEHRTTCPSTTTPTAIPTAPPTTPPTETPAIVPTATEAPTVAPPPLVPTATASPCMIGDSGSCDSGDECCPVHGQPGQTVCIPTGADCAQQVCAGTGDPCIYGSECCVDGATCDTGICTAPPPTPSGCDTPTPSEGCPCSSGTEHPCGTTELICCSSGAPGSKGVCTSSSTGCA